ncbi:YfhO family protein [Myxococcota bacterium]|nr:YfhO family protein [Myxococcota bacterium]
MTKRTAPGSGGERRSSPSRESGIGPGALWAMALIALAVLVWTLNLVSGVMPIALMNHDLYTEFFPRHHYQGNEWAAGRIPLWNPHQIAGLPFLATLQAGVLYPPNLLYSVLPTGTAMGGLGAFHVALAGLFAFALARRLDLGHEASALAGVTFMLGGSTLFLSYHTNAINSAPWFPAALLCTVGWVRDGDRRMALALAAVMALQFLAGRDYTFVITAHSVALVAALLGFQQARQGAGRRVLTERLAGVCLAGLLAAGFAAAQILPTLELAERSVRPLSGLPTQRLEGFAPMPPALLFANLVHPVRAELRREYLGLIPLVCFLAALATWRSHAVARFCIGAATAAALLILGSQTPLFEFYRTLPLGSTFRLPDRFIFPLSLAVAVGAGCGLDAVLKRRDQGTPTLRQSLTWLAGPLILAVLLAWLLVTGSLQQALEASRTSWGWFWYYGFGPDHFATLPRALGQLLLSIGVLGAAAWAAGAGYRRTAGIGVVVLAAADLGYALVNPLLHPARTAAPALAGAGCYRLVESLTPPLGRHLSLRLLDSYAIKDKDGQVFGTYSATHYDPLVTHRHGLYFDALQQDGPPLTPGPVDDVFMGFLRRVPTPERAKLLDLLGVNTVLVDGRRARRPEGLVRLLSHWESAGQCRVPTPRGPAPVALYTNPAALPRAFVVQNWERVDSPTAALKRLLEPDFDLRRRAVVESAPGSGTPSPQGPAPPSSAKILQYTAERVEVITRSPGPGLLVLTDTFTPNWSAEVDGRPSELLPTDALFRGVPVPAGEAQVVFHYQPRAFRIGAAISAASLLVGAGLAWRWRSERPRPIQTRLG